jgi:HAD superfamily hydrolase (TIGR01509 family)
VTTLALPAEEFGAYLFDLDGTIADTMPLHFTAWTQAVEEAGGLFPLDLFYALAGVPIVAVVKHLNETFGYRLDPDAVAHRKETLYLEMIDRVTPIASVLEHIELQRGRIPFAVVSGSPRDSIVRTLDVLGLLDRFDTLVGAEDYTRGKPDPEPFLVAAARLGVAPARCLVFEDAHAGIRSAEGAGMKWVRVPAPSVRQSADCGA